MVANRKSAPVYRWVGFAIVCALGVIGIFAAKSGTYLVVNQPQRSDVIVVLAGETDRRPARALQLFDQGYARRIVLDVPSNAKIYDFTQIELAEKYVQSLPQSAVVSVCPIDGLSTKEEAKDVATCLGREKFETVLIVTSDFHTRRALSVFRRELPQYRYSVAASFNEEQFGVRWWTHRQWAKIFVDEWLRLLWWKAVDEWQR